MRRGPGLSSSPSSGMTSARSCRSRSSRHVWACTRSCPRRRVPIMLLLIRPVALVATPWRWPLRIAKASGWWSNLVREVRPPFSPEAAVNEFVLALRPYGITTVTGDRFGGEFPREMFRRRGVAYALAQKARSDLYRDLLPMLNSRRVLLPRNDRLINQLLGLERRAGRSGKDLIDHPPNSHDDACNVVAGAVDLVEADAGTADVGLWFQARSRRGGIDPDEWAEAERNVAAGSAPCTVPLSEVSDETVRRFHARMASMEEPIPPGATGPSGIPPRRFSKF